VHDGVTIQHLNYLLTHKLIVMVKCHSSATISKLPHLSLNTSKFEYRSLYSYLNYRHQKSLENLCLLHRASLWQLKNKRRTWCHLLFYFTSYLLNMFRALIYPSSGACDYSVELPHWSCCSWFYVCWSFGVVGLEWYPCCRLQPATRILQNFRRSKSIVPGILNFGTRKRLRRLLGTI